MRLARGLILSTFLVSGAHAADYLRGSITEPAYQPPMASSPSYDWSGFYVGGTGVFANAHYKNHPQSFWQQANGSVYSAIANQLLPFTNRSGSNNKGGFSVLGGYNTMWDDVVLGLEGEYVYTKTRLTTPLNSYYGYVSTGTDTTRRSLVNMTSGSAVSEAKDGFGVLRARAGAAYGQFLPYFTIGVAGARVRNAVMLNGTVVDYRQDQAGNWNAVATSNLTNGLSKSSFRLGYTLGAGLDVALTSNIFLRANYEYVNLPSNNKTEIYWHTVKAGAGVKF